MQSTPKSLLSQTQNIRHFIDVLKILQYGNESGRLKLKDIENDSDYSCIPALLIINFFESID